MTEITPTDFEYAVETLAYAAAGGLIDETDRTLILAYLKHPEVSTQSVLRNSAYTSHSPTSYIFSLRELATQHRDEHAKYYHECVTRD
jgi:hypothetical protein|tara:strand:- start:2735 stop:2998 length:264 start_codon:yes stop_codon:yes gene_type:complete